MNTCLRRVDNSSNGVYDLRMTHWNQKVAKTRGTEWNQKLISGKLEAKMRPTFLRICRVEKGLSQSEIAEKVGLTYSTYGAYESGKRRLKESKALEISQVFGMPMTKLFLSLKDTNKVIARKMNAKH